MSTELIERENETLSIDAETKVKFESALVLLNGKSESISRVYDKEIIVDLEQLNILNSMMESKFQLHDITVNVTTVNVFFTNKSSKNFKSWDDFKNFDYSTQNSSVRSIVIEWDFMVKINYAIPQRHTVTVKISSFLNPSDMFKILLSGGLDERDDMEIQAATMYGKVNFVNHTLAEELLNVIDEWNNLCETAISKRSNFTKYISERSTACANISELSIIVLWAILTATVLKILISKNILVLSAETILYLIIALIPLSSVFRGTAREFGKKVYSKLQLVTQSHVFNLTRGDKKEYEKIKEKSNYTKELIAFIANIVISIVISIVFMVIE